MALVYQLSATSWIYPQRSLKETSSRDSSELAISGQHLTVVQITLLYSASEETSNTFGLEPSTEPPESIVKLLITKAHLKEQGRSVCAQLVDFR